MTAWYSPSYGPPDSRPGLELPVVPQASPRLSVNGEAIRSSSRASFRSRSRSPAPVIPDPNTGLDSPRLSADHARRLSGSASPRASTPLLSPTSPSAFQSSYMFPPRSRSASPIFIPPLETTDPGPPATDPIPVTQEEAPANNTMQFNPWAYPYNQVSYPQFSYYPPQPYPQPNVYSPYIPPGADMWSRPLLSSSYYTPQFPQAPVPPPAPPYGFPSPFNVSTVHNVTPFPATPMVMGPPTPWVPTTPWAGTPAVRVNPRLVPGGLRWDLLHHPDQARYRNDWGALKAPKFSDEAFTMAPESGGVGLKVSKIEISSSSHPVLQYWMGQWGPIPLPQHKMFDVLSAIYNYFYQPLTPREEKLLLDTPENVGHARRAKEVRAKDTFGLEIVVLREEGYKRIDVIGVHRGFWGIAVEKINPIVQTPAENNESSEEQEQQVEVELSLGLCHVSNAKDENDGY